MIYVQGARDTFNLSFRDIETGHFLFIDTADTETGLVRGQRLRFTGESPSRWRWEAFEDILPFDVVNIVTNGVVDKARP